MIILDVYSNEQWKYYRVEFHRAAHVLDFIKRVKELDASGFRIYHNFDLTEGTEFEPGNPDEAKLSALLYPQCHHGLSAELCMDPYGPHHFGTIEQEMAGLL